MKIKIIENFSLVCLGTEFFFFKINDLYAWRVNVGNNSYGDYFKKQKFETNTDIELFIILADQAAYTVSRVRGVVGERDFIFGILKAKINFRYAN